MRAERLAAHDAARRLGFAALRAACVHETLPQGHRVPPSVVLDGADQIGGIGIDPVDLKPQTVDVRHYARFDHQRLTAEPDIVWPIGDDLRLGVAAQERFNRIGACDWLTRRIVTLGGTLSSSGWT